MSSPTTDHKGARWRRAAAAAHRLIAGDGCSSSPELWYHQCCTEHDRAYAMHCDETGRPITRAEADAAFLRCMQASGRLGPIGRLFLPRLYWAAVRLFGRQYWQSSPTQNRPFA